MPVVSGMHMSAPPPQIQRVNVIKGWGLRNYDSSYNKDIVDFEKKFSTKLSCNFT